MCFNVSKYIPVLKVEVYFLLFASYLSKHCGEKVASDFIFYMFRMALMHVKKFSVCEMGRLLFASSLLCQC